jgi:hypothetical protein
VGDGVALGVTVAVGSGMADGVAVGAGDSEAAGDAARPVASVVVVALATGVTWVMRASDVVAAS